MARFEPFEVKAFRDQYQESPRALVGALAELSKVRDEYRDGAERRRLATHLSNVLARERENDRDLSAAPTWSRLWWKRVGRAGDLRSQRIETEGRLELLRYLGSIA